MKRLADTPKEIREYHIHRSHLYSTDGVAVYKDRVIIPVTLREDCLKALHAAHQGVTMMLSNAEASIFWPGIAADISHHRSTCSKLTRCRHHNHHSRPGSPHKAVPEHLCRLFPQQRVVIVDRYSNWPIVERSCYWPCREIAIHIRNLRHSRRYHNRRGS